MSFQLNYCIMLFVVVSSSALLHCTANVNLTNTRCALDYLRLDSPYCPPLSQTKTHTLFPFFQSKSLYALMCLETIALPMRGCKVDDTYFTDAAFIKNNDNIWPRGSTCDAMNE